MFDLSFSDFIVSTIVSSVGFVAFIYGKKRASWKAMAGGAVLLALPFVVQKVMPLSVGGLLILSAMYIFRD